MSIRMHYEIQGEYMRMSEQRAQETWRNINRLRIYTIREQLERFVSDVQRLNAQTQLMGYSTNSIIREAPAPARCIYLVDPCALEPVPYKN